MFLNNNDQDCLKRVENETFPPFTLDTSFAPEQERKVLLNIYESTKGQKWFESRGWTSLANEESHCSWYGITCHENTSYVKTIVLAYNNLMAPFLPPFGRSETCFLYALWEIQIYMDVLTTFFLEI